MSSFRSTMRAFFAGRMVWWLGTIVVLFIAGWFGRYGILRSVGGFLIRQDPPAKADAMYVLGGAPIERSIAAARFFRDGLAPHAVFTGSNTPQVFELYGLHHSEARMGQRVALLAGMPEDRTEVLEQGTSTMEEAWAVRDHAIANGYDTVLIVTTEFHTRRVGKVFRKVIEPAGITVLVRAAPSARYDPAHWWESEDGLLMVNNEYVKLLYYAWKY